MSSKGVDALRRKFDNRLAQIAGAVTMYAIIKSVDVHKRTCTVTIDGADFTDVLLYTIENKDLNGFVFIPTVDSVVLVSRIGASNELYVSMFSEVNRVLLTIGDKVKISIDDKELRYENDKVSLKVNGEKVELNAEKVVFNGGDNKGIVKIHELTEKINALVDAHNTHTHTLISGTVAVAGSATSQSNPAPITVPAITTKAQKLNMADYENDKVKH